MEHVAIMKKSWNMIDKMLTGEKTIESRWYRTKRAPWNKIYRNDKIYFKDSGEKVVASACVKKVKQFIFKNENEINEVIKTYGEKICLVESDYAKWKSVPRYAILIYLTKVKKIKPFNVDKKGYGCGCAWLTFPKKIKKLV